MKSLKNASFNRSFFILAMFILTALWLFLSQPTALAAPDLTVSGIDSSAITTDCQSLAIAGTINATISNTGTSDTTTGFTILIFEDANRNGAYDAGIDIILGSSATGALAADTDTTVSATLSGTVAFKGNLIYAFADSLGEIAESDESNNYSNSGLACEFQPTPGAFNPELEWSWTSSTVEPARLNVMMTPGVIDLNDDGMPDVVFGSTSSTTGGLVEIGVLRALSGADGAELFTVNDPTMLISTTASVAVGDIDGDGRPEILACDTSGIRLIAFEHDGTFKWRSPNLEAINWGGPSIADLDGDGSPEIVIGRQVLNNDGSIRWSGAGGRGSQGSVGPLSLVADINMDGSPDVVAGNTVYTVSGAVAWQAPLADGYNAVANFDDDVFPEIVLVSGGRVWLLEHTGAVKWGPAAIPAGGAGGPPTVADYDNDGEVEIGVAGAYRYAVFETNGTLKWAAVTQDSSSNRTGSSVFDFEGDGSAEVVYSDELTLRVYRGTDGAVLFQTPLSSCTWHEYPLVADVDADGNAEIVAVANNNCGFGAQRGIYVYGDAGDNWVTTRRIWNQHTYHITNINDNGTIPVIESNNWESFNNYRQNVQTAGSVLAAPDLTASLLKLDTNECPDAVGISARIGNGGSNVAAAPVNVAFYDGDPNAGGTLLGVVPTTLDLDPGEFEDVTLVVTPVLQGIRTICVVVDDNGTGTGSLNECDETNNQCCAVFTSFCCVEDLAARPKSGKVQLTWTYTGAHHYNVYRGTASGGPYVLIASTTSTYSTYLDTNVVDGTTYYYIVRESAANGDEICQSNEANATPTARVRR